MWLFALSSPITAVPEPSTYAMALVGLTCGGFAMSRRLKRASITSMLDPQARRPSDRYLHIAPATNVDVSRSKDCRAPIHSREVMCR